MSVPFAGVPREMLEIRFIVEPEYAGWRLDRYLQHKIPRLSRTRVQRILPHQATLSGRSELRPATRVQAGQELVMRRPIPPEPAHPTDFAVLYEDDSLLAVDKPAGLAMHATARYHRGTLTWLLRAKRPNETIQITHRLDRETSGVIICAKNSSVAAGLKGMFATRRVQKYYTAIVEGVLLGEGIIDLPLALSRESKLRVKMEVRGNGDGLTARTRWRSLCQSGDLTMVQAIPETGRQHQIRVHLAALGHPVVGDKLYLDEAIFYAFCENRLDEQAWQRLRLPRHALHASRVEFVHPVTGAPLAIDSPLPPEMASLMDVAT